MILDFLLSNLFSLINPLIELLPDITFDLDVSTFSSFYQYLHVVLWVLPCGTIAAVAALQLLLIAFRAVVSLIKTLWQLLPLL